MLPPVSGARSAAPVDPAKIREVASELQSVFVQQMLSVMRESSMEGPFGGGEAEKTLEVLLDQNLSSKISAAMPTSITRSIEARLTRLVQDTRVGQ